MALLACSSAVPAALRPARGKARSPRRRFAAIAGAALLGLLGLTPQSFAADPGSTTVVPAITSDQAFLAGPSPRALAAALDAMSCARSRGIAGRDDLVTVLDYTLPSNLPRLWVLDLAHHKVLFHELVAHGSGSGELSASRFSNAVDSRASSLGLYLTGTTYEGGKGYSLRLRGLDPGLNDRAEQRNIVMHGAWYVSDEQIERYGRLGRSWGCPAVPVEMAHPIIDAIQGGSFVYAYGESGDADPATVGPARCAVPAAMR